MTTALVPTLVDDQLAEINASAPRYQVINAGRALWHIVDRTTGRAAGFEQGYAAALAKADVLEARHAS